MKLELKLQSLLRCPRVEAEASADDAVEAEEAMLRVS